MEDFILIIALKFLLGMLIIVMISVAAERQKPKTFEKFVEKVNSDQVVHPEKDLYESFTTPNRVNNKWTNGALEVKKKPSISINNSSEIIFYHKWDNVVPNYSNRHISSGWLGTMTLLLKISEIKIEKDKRQIVENKEFSNNEEYSYNKSPTESDNQSKKLSQELLELVAKKSKENEWLCQEDWIDKLPIENWSGNGDLEVKKNLFYLQELSDVTGVLDKNLSGTTKNLDSRGYVKDFNFSFQRNVNLSNIRLNLPEKRILWNACFNGYKNFKKMHGRFPSSEEPYGSWANKQRKDELDKSQIQEILALNPYFFNRNKSEEMIDFLTKNYHSKYKKTKFFKQYFRRKFVLGTLNQKEFESLLKIDNNIFKNETHTSNKT